MKKIILVIYDPSIDSDVLRDRIKSLGPSYTFFGNHWIIETNLSTKEVYEKISIDEFEYSSMIVISMEKSNGYWGRMNTSLWDWLKERENN